MLENDEKSTTPFNSPVECGVRAMVLLGAASPAGCDLRRLVIYDYLLVHSGDVPADVVARLSSSTDQPESLHPPTPHRAGELLVRRVTLAAGLRLLMTKGLAKPRFGSDGISYVTTELSQAFLELLESDYVRALCERGKWVVSVFSKMADEDLSGFANRHLRDWGGEFVNESLLRGGT
ncbi:MAG: hypothetical protein NTY19_25720 [Planctomycetota bacterium]|nr:hypothetical protein [Planctomycetota bacterium]